MCTLFTMSFVPPESSPCRRLSPGPAHHGCSTAHADLVHTYRDAAREQEERAERAAGGDDPTALRSFYRDPDAPQADVSEQRLTFRTWLTMSRRMV